MYEGQGWAESRGALYEVLGIQKLTHIAPDFGEPPETSLTVGRDRPCDSRMFREQGTAFCEFRGGFKKG